MSFVRNNLILFAIFAIFCIIGIASLSSGAAGFGFQRVVDIVMGNGSPVETSIFYGIRLPRAILALSVGASLSLAGLILQSLFRNPLVEPYTIGISGGASFAVCLAVVFGLMSVFGRASVYVAGFVGAISVVFLLCFLHSKGVFKGINGLLLAGVMLSFIFSSLITLLLAVSNIEDAHGILFWLMGSLENTNLKLSFVSFALSLFCLAVGIFYSHELDALLLGEEGARHLGVDVRNSQLRFFLTASLLTALSVSLSGIIAFVGLAVPLLLRKLIGTSHRYLVPCAFFGGGAFLALCDIFARTVISPRELPVGVITGIIGGTIFTLTLLKSQNS